MCEKNATKLQNKPQLFSTEIGVGAQEHSLTILQLLEIELKNSILKKKKNVEELQCREERRWVLGLLAALRCL